MSMSITIMPGSGSVIKTVQITEASYVSRNAMGDSTAYIEFFRQAPTTISPGDYCTIFGQRYYFRDTPIPVRDSNRLKYQCTLKGSVHELEKAIFFISDSTGAGVTSDVSWNCSPLEFLTQLVANMQRLQPLANWQVGSCLTADAKTIQLNSSNCLDALRAAADLWETHYSVNNNIINLTKVINDPVHTLEVGKGLGLREITANKSNDSKVITRLYPYGSDINSPTGERLSISPITYPGATEIIEGVAVFDDIYPQFLLTVTTVVGPLGNIFTTNPTGFKVDDYAISGRTPQMTFLTGECAGLTFKCLHIDIDDQPSYAAVPYYLDGGIAVPGSPGYQVFPGDKFEIWNTLMPEYFILDAEARLEAKALAYLGDHQQKVKLNVRPDDIYFRANNITLDLGDRLTIISSIIPQLNTPGIVVEVIGYKRRIIESWAYESLIVGDVVLKQPDTSGIQKIVERIIMKSTEVGVSDKHYTHSQPTQASAWLVNHNLGKKPSVVITDLAGVQLDGLVTYLGDNTLVINFSIPVSGLAICN